MSLIATLVAVISAATAIQNNLKKGIHFQYRYWDMVAYAIGISPALLYVAEMIRRSAFEPLVLWTAIHTILLVTSCMALYQAISARKESPRPTSQLKQFFLLISVAMVAYFLSCGILLIYTFAVMKVQWRLKG